jgi:hypothetical protein
VPDGYAVQRVRRYGGVFFLDATPAGGAQPWQDRNFHSIMFDGLIVSNEDWSDRGYKAYYPGNDDLDLAATPHPISDGRMTLTLGFQDLHSYYLTFVLELSPSAQQLLDWRTQVYQAVLAKESELVDARNREKEMVYQAAMADYRRAVSAIRGTAVNALLEGGAEATNRAVIEQELRRHCLAELTKEFDADRSNDMLSNLETVGSWDVTFTYRRLAVAERADGGGVVASFETRVGDARYPATMLDEARRKGHRLQFLEQAFEWQHLAFLFYPYFWATPPKWIDHLSRADDADATYTAFLQAGAARVLVAVSPGYEHAVSHYLATGHPWDGGQAPVIGDPLFVPIYEELRDAQDDLEGATPEGESWSFVIPTSLVYLEGGDALPEIVTPPTP